MLHNITKMDTEKKAGWGEGLGTYRTTSHGVGEQRKLSWGYDPNIENSATNDAVFGDVTGGPNYRSVRTHGYARGINVVTDLCRWDGLVL